MPSCTIFNCIEHDDIHDERETRGEVIEPEMSDKQQTNMIDNTILYLNFDIYDNDNRNTNEDEKPLSKESNNENDVRENSESPVMELLSLPPDLFSHYNNNPRVMKLDNPILITGGAGFIGSHVANFLLQRGDNVVILDEMNNYYDVHLKRANLDILRNCFGSDRLHIYEGDICDEDLTEKIFSFEQPQRIIHLAARAGVRPSIDDPLIYIHSNIKATTILLELARRYSCISFVFASSSSVYGGSDKTKFSETDTVDFPVSPYAATKKSCELLAFTYYHLYGLNCSGLRFFTVYGPRGRPDMAPFKFIDRISRGVTIQKFGDGSSSRDYTYIDDIVDGVVRSLDQPLGYQIYNLGNENPVELNHFIKTVEKFVGKAAKIEQLPDQPGDVPRTCANISKAQQMLGYQPKTDFEEGILRTVQWYNKYYGNN